MFRAATDDDLVDLRDVEREANRVALGHVFPPDRYPFPDADVLARWRIVLDDPEVAVAVVDDPRDLGLVAFVAHDDTSLRHLAVRPDHWGQGLATAAIEHVLRAMDLRGAPAASLWCLLDNDRARSLYEYLGWRPTEDIREAAWPPHPLELRYTRLLPGAGRPCAHG